MGPFPDAKVVIIDGYTGTDISSLCKIYNYNEETTGTESVPYAKVVIIMMK